MSYLLLSVHWCLLGIKTLAILYTVITNPAPPMFYILLLKCSPTPEKKTRCTPTLGVLGKLVTLFSHILYAVNSKENQQPKTP